MWYRPVIAAALGTGAGGLSIQGWCEQCLKQNLKGGLGCSSAVERLPGVPKALPSLLLSKEGGRAGGMLSG